MSRKWAQKFCRAYGHAVPKFKVYVYRTKDGTRIAAQEWCPRCGETFHDEVL